MKRGIYLLVILCMLCISAEAQKVKFGLRAGASFSQWTEEENMEYDPLIGMVAGPYVNISANELLSFELGLYYSKKGAKFNRTYERTGEDVYLFVEQDGRYNLSYLDFPVLARLTLWKGLNVYAGPQLSFLVSYCKKEKGQWVLNGEKHSLERTEYDQSSYNKLDLGMIAGLGYQFNNGLNVNAGYGHGLYKIYKERWDPEVYNRAVKISLGYLF